ncbi:hypothetical protein RND71_000452 [Anisodus tanguticus]|uniref:Uncharacterized protein n=1 Tax=Anisodus tanguticus TaxID=243964 RepID=A0AAE1SZH7_9SOLA|nr:hypothetical protein RND71_000452 [Anisodus tanguticus]
MDRRRCICKWCGMNMAAQIGAQTITCPRCQSVTQVQPARNNGFANSPTANNNMRPGFPAFLSRPGRMSPNTNNFPTTNNNMSPEFPARLGRMSPNANNFPITNNNISPEFPARPGRMSPNANNFPSANNNMSPGFPAYPARPRRMMSPNANNFQPQQFNIMSPQINNIRPPAVHGRKLAVLCGINYRGHPKSFKGSINFPKKKVELPAQEPHTPAPQLNKISLTLACSWLSVRRFTSVPHYSGHGARVRDRDGDEIDGHDESLCPVDYETEGGY